MFSLIATASGLGGICGVLIVNQIAKKIKSGKLIANFLILNGIFWLLAIILHQPIFTTMFIFLSYFCSGIYNIVYNGLYQSLPPINVLGRVNTSIDSLITLAMPLGGLAGGLVLKLIAPIWALSLFGVCVILVGIFYWRKKRFINLPNIEDINRLV